VTSDNPRSEEPQAIIADIEPAVRAVLTPAADTSASRGYLVEPDRARAIALAIAAAGPADVVLVAGKGHEDYQEVAGVRHPFDDRQVVARILAER